MKHKTSEIMVPERLIETNIEQHCSVKWSLPVLNQINKINQKLTTAIIRPRLSLCAQVKISEIVTEFK